MSVVPLIFRDWWDDFERPVSRLMDQHFGRGLNRDDLLSRFSDISFDRPLRSIFRDRYYRPWRNVTCQPSSGSSTIQLDNKDNFQVGKTLKLPRQSSRMFRWTCENKIVQLDHYPLSQIEDLQSPKGWWCMYRISCKILIGSYWILLDLSYNWFLRAMIRRVLQWWKWIW